MAPGERSAQRKPKRRRFPAGRSATYGRLRRKVGTQDQVARILGIDKQTISNRERGIYRIDNEAMLAMERLVERTKPSRRRGHA